MPPYKLFFISGLLFLVGILLVSLEMSVGIVLIAALTAFFALTYYFGLRPIIFISLLIVAGAFYYLADDYGYYNNLRAVSGTHEFRGVIITDPERSEKYQSFYLAALKNSINPGVRILVKTKLDPEYHYGDELSISGNITRPPDDDYGRYLSKEKIHGISSYPKINLIASEQGNVILAPLLKFKNRVSDSFKKLLGGEQAAFLSGITLGNTEDFSKELLNAFSLSGTRHLVAIAGLHMTIITTLLLTMFSYLMPKKYAFILTSIAAVAFTAMIGFKLTTVRAVIMGIIAGSSRMLVGRPYAVYNAIMLAAIGMILINPKVLVFDVGFELSFIAIAAIIYLTPLLQYIFNISREGGRWNWKELLIMTASIQIATAPILITQFHNFSLISLAANVLVLPAVPIIMFLAFLMAGLAFISYYPAFIVGLIITPIINYVLWIINLSAKFSLTYDPILSWPAILIYYAILVYLIYDFHTSSRYKIEISPGRG